MRRALRSDRRRSWASIRVVAAVLATVIAWGEVGTLLHFAAVTHVRCSHGQLVHADHGEGAEGTQHDTPATGPAVTDAAPSDQHGHDHCGISGVPPLSALPAAATVALSEVRTAASLARPADAPAPSARYTFAPKTSPPALG